MSEARIMIVEDDAIVAADLKNRLTGMGYFIVFIASTGEEAIEQAGIHLPDVILMDIHLAGKMDGITAAFHIGEQYKIPIVYLTAYSDEETLARARKTHPAGYVLKPFEPRSLYVAIEMALYTHPHKDGV